MLVISFGQHPSAHTHTHIAKLISWVTGYNHPRERSKQAGKQEAENRKKPGQKLIMATAEAPEGQSGRVEADQDMEVNVAGRPSNYHQNPISWPMQCRVPDPNPAFSFQLPASSFVLVQLPAFCQRLFAKLIPKKVSQTCDLKQSVPARLEQPTNHPAPHLPVLHTKGQSLCPFLFYSFCCCSCCLPSGHWPPPQLSSAQLSSASTQFVTIPFCGLIFALLVSLSYFPFLPLSLSL